MMSETEKQDLTPEEESVTSRDEAGEPSGEEDPAAEEEHLRDKEAFEAANEEQALRDMEEASDAANEEQALVDMEEASDADDPLASAERQRDEYLELAQRTQADFENYRKRAAREAAAAGERAKSGLVRELLPIVDNLERALASAEAGEQHLAEGVRLVHAELIAVLERNGVEQFNPSGDRFDPSEHEALSVREDGEPGLVLDVVEKGYRANGTVLRPARVVVSG